MGRTFQEESWRAGVEEEAEGQAADEKASSNRCWPHRDVGIECLI